MGAGFVGMRSQNRKYQDGTSARHQSAVKPASIDASTPHASWRRRPWLLVILALALLATACSGSGGSGGSDSPAVAAAEANQGSLTNTGDLRTIEVLNVVDGSTTTLQDAVTGDRPVLLWFYAPH